MIEKSRLEELIEQGANVYEIVYSYNGDIVCEYDLKNLPTYYKTNLEHFLDLHTVFETIEDAKWHKEFGCIERTERLELPTWEEFKLREPYNYFIFTSKDMQYGLGIGAYYREIIINNNGSVLFQEKFTKENYTLACRKAKELFLGEKENDR